MSKAAATDARYSAMGDVLEEVLAAARRQGLRVRTVPNARQQFDRALRTFTGGVDAQWWWEHLQPEAVFRHFDQDDGFRYLHKIVPDPDRLVLFVVEDDEEPFFPVLEASPRTAQSIVAESFAFEYYLVDSEFRWMVGENHHSSLFAIGSPAADRLRELKAAGPRDRRHPPSRFS